MGAERVPGVVFRESSRKEREDPRERRIRSVRTVL
jgi:hypothetical protein